MKLQIEIATGNAAFHDDDGTYDPGPECSRILRRLASQISHSLDELPLRLLDQNGGAVGLAEVSAE